MDPRHGILIARGHVWLGVLHTDHLSVEHIVSQLPACLQLAIVNHLISIQIECYFYYGTTYPNVQFQQAKVGSIFLHSHDDLNHLGGGVDTPVIARGKMIVLEREDLMKLDRGCEDERVWEDVHWDKPSLLRDDGRKSLRESVDGRIGSVERCTELFVFHI